MSKGEMRREIDVSVSAPGSIIKALSGQRVKISSSREYDLTVARLITELSIVKEQRASMIEENNRIRLI